MEADKPLRRRRGWIIAISAVIGLAMIQSVTYTPAVEVRYVDKTSGAPVGGLRVTAVWRLYAATPAGRLNSRVLRVHAIVTDIRGDAYLPASVMLHPPVFPFGVDVRQIDALPILYANDQRYRPDSSFGSRWDEAVALSFLSFQKTSIDETVIKLAMGEMPPTTREQDARQYVDSSVRQALSSCRRSRFCQLSGTPL